LLEKVELLVALNQGVTSNLRPIFHCPIFKPFVFNYFSYPLYPGQVL